MGDVTNLSRFVFGLAARGLTMHGEYKVIYITTDHSLSEKGFNDEYRQLTANTDWTRCVCNKVSMFFCVSSVCSAEFD